MAGSPLKNQPQFSPITGSDPESTKRWSTDVSSKLSQWCQTGTNRIQGVPTPAPAKENDGQALTFDAASNSFAYSSTAPQPTAVTPGTYGDATHVGQFTVQQDGRLTEAASIPIVFPSSSSPGAGYLIGPGPGGVVTAGVEYSGVRFAFGASDLAGTGNNAFPVGVPPSIPNTTGASAADTGDARRAMVKLTATSGSFTGRTINFNSGGTATTPTFASAVRFMGTFRGITTANVRIFIGLCNAETSTVLNNFGTEDTGQSANFSYAALRFSTTAGTTWAATAGSNGVGDTDTAIPGTSLSTSTIDWCIDTTNYATTGIDYWVNGVKLTLSGANLPPGTDAVFPFFVISELSTSTATAAFGGWSLFTPL